MEPTIPQQPQQPLGQQLPEKKSNGALMGIIIIVILLILGGIYLLQSSLKKSPSETNESMEIGADTQEDTMSDTNSTTEAELEMEAESMDLESLDSEI